MVAWLPKQEQQLAQKQVQWPQLQVLQAEMEPPLPEALGLAD